MSQTVLVLGCGAAATAAIEEMRSRGYAGEITVLCDNDLPPYSPVLTSYYAAGQIEQKNLFAWGEDFCSRMGVSFVGGPGAKVEKLDAEGHMVTTADGTQYPYQLCLIATGARPWVPEDLPLKKDPLVLRTHQDAQDFKDALEAQKGSLVVLGTSMVALKAAEAAREQGWDVTLVGRSSHILTRSGHPMVSQRFQELLEQRGVSLILNCAELSDQQALLDEADLVLVAYGVAPNTDFLSQEVLDDTMHLVTDDYQHTVLSDVFAAGDCCSCLDILGGGSRSFGLWAPAHHQGRVAGAAMASQLMGLLPQSSAAYPGTISASTIHTGDLLFVSVGDVTEEGRRIEAQDEEGALLVKLWETSSDGSRRLMGFNLLATLGQDGKDSPLLNALGSLHQEVLNGCWDAAAAAQGGETCTQSDSVSSAEDSMDDVLDYASDLYPAEAFVQVCHHCLQAPCLDACPAGALSQVGEQVLVDGVRCIGCRSCALACPFDIPRYYSNGTMYKEDCLK